MDAMSMNVSEPKSVKIAQDSSRTSSVKLTSEKPLGGWLRTWIANHTQWIVKNWNWSKLKPVIRCAVVAWVALVLFVIPRVEVFFGQASFLILIAVFLAPPSDPFISVLEREFLILLFVSIAWAWACFGIFLANLARRVHNPAATIFDVVDGQFIEAAPTVIFGIFVFFGSAFFLYVKARQGPGPYFFASIFACLCLDISLTTAVLFPFPFYLIGKSIILPLAFASALSLLGSIFLFPSTISAQFTTRLQNVLTPIISAIDLHRALLNTPFPTDSDTRTSSMSTTQYTEKVDAASTAIKASEAALGSLAASARLMRSDLIYGRFSPLDFVAFQQMCRRMSGRTNGLATFFSFVGVGAGAGIGLGADKNNGDTPAHTLPDSPGIGTPRAGPSRKASMLDDDEGKPHISTIPSSPHSILSHSKPPSSSLHRRHLHHDQSHNALHASLLSLSRPTYDKPNRGHETEHAVGTFESHRYLNLEATRLWDPNWEEWTRKALQDLGESCDPVLEVCRDGLTAVNTWLGGIRRGRITYLLGIRRKERDEMRAETVKQMKELKDKISGVLESFRSDKRLRILNPYRPEFKTSTSQSQKPKSEVQDSGNTADTSAKSDELFDDFGADEEHQMPHRHLFRSYFYQYQLIRVCSIIIEMIDEIIKLEEKRPHDRLWTRVGNIFKKDKHSLPEDADKTEDDDPDVIEGFQHDSDLEDEDDDKSLISDDLGMPRVRDPDALPPRNSTEWVMTRIHMFIMGLGGGNAIFAVKAGLLTVLLCLPSFLKSSAGFAYENKFVWAVFMGQLTLARFRGDTAFGLASRLLSTFFGGLTGLVIWYISCGPERGNAFGLAAVCGVCFPFFMFVRLYAPISPVTNGVYFATVSLVIGYSYQDIHFVLPGSPGFGWTIAWRRFVLVTAGVVAAFLVSFLPPSTTIRKYHRNLLSTTSTLLGTIYCAILSFASTKEEPEIQEIISSLLALRAKLNRSVIIRTNIDYEFSLKGRWPKERYHKIVDRQIAISYSLSNLISVLEHLEPSWARAFLRRTRFMDPDFQGDVLAVISMIASSLRTGSPLPQITPCPLLDRFLLQYHGLNVIHKEAGEDYGLPRSVTFDTLKNEQYLMFCVGVTTAFNFINRLDQLMLAAKEVVGEHYHIHGVGGSTLANPILKEGVRPFTTQFQPPGGDVV